jgi:DnaD/phage-associated family protein
MGKIFKVQLENKFMQVPNETAKLPESSVSLQALGLLVNIMSYADTWEIHKTELYKRYAKNKETSVRGAWNELVQANYIIECKIRIGKKWDYNYFVRLQPFSDIEKEEIKKQIEAQTPEETPVFWTLDFQDLKMKTSKSRDNKKRIKEKLIKEIQTGKYVSSASVKYVFENYQPNKAEQRILIELIDSHGDELSLEAIQRAFNKGNKIDNVMQYIKGILENWDKSELKTVEEVLAYEKAYHEAMKPKKKKSSQKKSSNKPSGKPVSLQQKIMERINQTKEETAAGFEDMTDEELQQFRENSLKILEQQRNDFSPTS